MAAPGYLNNGTTANTPLPLADYHIDTPAEQYDLNFVFPVKVLENDLIRLEPLIPSIYARALFEALSTEEAAALYTYRKAAQPTSFRAFLTHLEERRRLQSGCYFVILDKTNNNVLAGYTGYTGASQEVLKGLIGPVIILPKFQRTHVQTNSTALLISYAMSPSPIGLDFRHIGWGAWHTNLASQKAALRLGFKYCGTDRNFWVTDGKPADPVRPRIADKWLSQITIEDWRNGAEQNLLALVEKSRNMINTGASPALGAVSTTLEITTGLAYSNSLLEKSMTGCNPIQDTQLHLKTAPSEYDLNFCWNVPLLESDMIRLEPFIPSVHGWDLTKAFNDPVNEHLLDHLSSWKPQGSIEKEAQRWEVKRRNNGEVMYAILDKSREEDSPQLAGLLGVRDTRAKDKWTEVGPAVVFSPFQRTHVLTQALGLLLQHAFEAEPNGWSVVAMRWYCSSLNIASERAALRFGFKRDSFVKHAKALQPGDLGDLVEGSDRPSRHGVVLSITAEDWAGGVEQHVQALMARKY